MRAAILTVGTEITSGEIVDRNSSWLARQLESEALTVVLHVSTPDDRPLIAKFLKQALETADVVFVTGGLGPTTDDFTREVIAEFMNRPLCFNETVWKSLQSLYEARELPLRPAHRQQCYFPENAEILENPVGTAQGFLCIQGSQKIFVLPGPPAEVEGVYSQSILPRLRSLKLKRNLNLTIFKCIGAPESEIAEIVEETLRDRGFQLGYRASHPYVLVKVWHPPEGLDWQQGLISKLKTWYIGNADFDFAHEWLIAIQELTNVKVLDAATGGLLMGRLEAAQGTLPKLAKMVLGDIGFEVTAFLGAAMTNPFQSKADQLSTRFAISADESSDQFTISADIAGNNFSETLKLPYKSKARSERARRLMAEEALRFWSQWVKALDQ